MRQKTINLWNQGSFEKKFDFFPQTLGHTPRWVRLVQKTRAKNSHAWAPLIQGEKNKKFVIAKQKHVIVHKLCMNLNLNVEQFNYFFFHFSTTKLSKLWKKQRSSTQKLKGLMGLKNAVVRWPGSGPRPTAVVGFGTPPPPHPQASVCLCTPSCGGGHSFAEKGSQFRRGDIRVVLYIQYKLYIQYVRVLCACFVLIWEGLHYSLRRTIQF
jgi:hypothetical protein